MLGYIHTVLHQFVIRYHSEEVYKKILKQAGYEQEVEWNSKTVYPDQDTYRLFRALGSVLGQTGEDVWENFGVFMCKYAVENGWSGFLNCIANNLQEFLDNLSSAHFFIDQIAFQAEMRGPTFRCEVKSDGSLRLHYYSARRGLYPLAKGMVRQAAKMLFGLDIRMIVTERLQEKRNDQIIEHVIFTLESTDESIPLIRPNVVAKETAIPMSLPMIVQCFCAMYPTHVCFNKSLMIEHCGEFIQKELSLSKRRLTKLTDILTLIQPDDISCSFKGMSAYLNSLFIFQFKQPMRRNELIKKQSFFLKGQMIVVNGGNSLLYMNSPHITNPQTLTDTNLFLADFQRHDATRDLIMLNQSHMKKTDKKVDDSKNQLVALTEELEATKTKIEKMTYAGLPQSIASLIRNGEKVPARKLDEITCLYAEVAHFRTIISNNTPKAILSLVSDLWRSFDRLVKLHLCTKVCSQGETCLIICDNHEQILNLSLEMVAEAKQILVPRVNLPVLLRISINTGPALTGVLNGKKPRYCVFSETTTTCKRLAQNVEPGKILVANSTKQLAPTFKFISKGDIKLGNGQTINTHFLDCPNESVVQKWNLFYQTDKQYDCSSKMSSRGFAQKFLGSTRTITGQSLDSGISSSTAESVTCSIQ